MSSPAIIAADEAIFALETRGGCRLGGDAYAARERGLASEPLAASFRFDGNRDTIVVEMNNGASLNIPRRLLQGLENASPEQLRAGEIAGHGTSLCWLDLDVDFSVVGILHGVYGGKRWMSELARRAAP